MGLTEQSEFGYFNNNIGKNGIDNVGVLILISAHWKNIVSLNLCICAYIKGETILKNKKI